MNNVLITGANGFVGRCLCSRLQSQGLRVRGSDIKRAFAPPAIVGVELVTVDPVGPDTAWQHALDGIDIVIHLAARVHIMNDTAADPLAEFRRVNAHGSERLAREAAEAGVRRLVYMSTIKVNGEESDTPYTVDSPPRPTDPYGVSKWEAEQVLRRIESETGLEVVVLRSPLVYGPGVKGNFLRMMQIVQRGIPLPLASVKNKRSLIYVGNLVDALSECAIHPVAGGRTYLVSDGEDIATPELIRSISRSMGIPDRLFPCPPSILRLAGRICGKQATVDRLIGSLVVDYSGICSELGWRPPFNMERGILETAQWFLQENSNWGRG